LYLLSPSLAGLDGCNNNDDDDGGEASLNGNGLWNMQKEKVERLGLE
jgi:hypothetical protein